jgi:hypothetical protein
MRSGPAVTGPMTTPTSNLNAGIAVQWANPKFYVTHGLIMATSLVMSRAADHDWRAYLLTAICTAIFVFTKTNPLIVVGAAGVIGYFGVV